MESWAVVSPEYSTVIPVLDDGTGPMEHGCDYIQIEAKSRQDALILGVKAMRQDPAQYPFLNDCGTCPYTGFKVFQVDL